MESDNTRIAPRRRFQLSLVELLAATISFAVLLTWCSLIFSPDVLEDAFKWVAIVMAAFIVFCARIFLSSRGINRLFSIAVLLISSIAGSGLLNSYLSRNIMARNETDVVKLCHDYCRAQHTYSGTDYNMDGRLEYAQSLKDLYHTAPLSPDGTLIPERLAKAEGASGKPYKGFLFRVLTGQGSSASGGSRSYIVDNRMILGYGLLAYPALYDRTGRNTFIVNNSGTIYQKDQGESTPDIVKKMTEFNPDSTWSGGYDD
jgi:hypothetical protein